MKKFLLATVALVALGATVPALAADLGAAPTPRRPAAYRADLQLDRLLHRRPRRRRLRRQTTVSPAHRQQQRRPLPRRRAGRRRLPVRAELGASVSKASTPGSAATTTPFLHRRRRRLRLHPQPARPRLGHRPPRLHLGSGAALRQGRLCLFRLQRNPDASAACRRFTLNGSHHDGYTVGGGLEYMFAPNWSGKVEYQYYDFGNTNFVTPRRADGVRQHPQRRAHRQGRPQLPLQLGGPVVAQVLIAGLRAKR